MTDDDDDPLVLAWSAFCADFPEFSHIDPHDAVGFEVVVETEGSPYVPPAVSDADNAGPVFHEWLQWMVGRSPDPRPKGEDEDELSYRLRTGRHSEGDEDQ